MALTAEQIERLARRNAANTGATLTGEVNPDRGLARALGLTAGLGTYDFIKVMRRTQRLVEAAHPTNPVVAQHNNHLMGQVDTPPAL